MSARFRSRIADERKGTSASEDPRHMLVRSSAVIRPMTRLLALLVLIAVLAAPVRAAAPRASLVDIEDEVMCVTCKIPLNIAESPQATRERDLIRRLIDRDRDGVGSDPEAVAIG